MRRGLSGFLCSLLGAAWKGRRTGIALSVLLVAASVGCEGPDVSDDRLTNSGATATTRAEAAGDTPLTATADAGRPSSTAVPAGLSDEARTSGSAPDSARRAVDQERSPETKASSATATPSVTAPTTPTSASSAPVTSGAIHEHMATPCDPGNLPAFESWYWENQVQWHPASTSVFFSRGPVVYAATVDGSQVETVADASATERTLTSTPYVYGLMTSFDVTSQGDRLVFATCAYPREPVGMYEKKHAYDIAVVDLRLGDIQRLTANRSFQNYPSWSPDGTRIAYLAGSPRYSGLVVWGAKWPGVAPDYPVVMHPPQWSPDGESLAVVGLGPDADYYVSRRFLYTLRRDGTEWQLLGRTASGPSWSPDGERLAFVATDDETGDDRLLVTMAPDGTEMQQVPVPAGWEPSYQWGHAILADLNWISTVAWSPAGDQLLYTCGWHIRVVGLDGTPVGQSPIGFDAASVAAWSPDGARIAVAAGARWETGSYWSSGPLLYTMAPDGSDVRVLAEAGLQPVAAQASKLGVADSQAACAAGYIVPEPDANPGLVRDCKVLIGLREALFPGDDSNWNPGTSIGQWVGVTVEGESPRVAALEMPQQAWDERSRRPIPPDLSALTRLHSLILGYNNFSGPIPRELVQLESLGHLDLSGNDLTGPPLPELSRLSNLSTLDLSWNRLTGPIPKEVIQLTNLQRLDLSGNEFTGPIPPELAQLATLEELNLSFNQLTGSIPPELGQLTALRSLDLSRNQLTGPIPPELDGLTSLEWLRLRQNDLTGCIPPGLRERMGWDCPSRRLETTTTSGRR